jgi:hypothetical protein
VEKLRQKRRRLGLSREEYGRLRILVLERDRWKCQQFSLTTPSFPGIVFRMMAILVAKRDGGHAKSGSVQLSRTKELNPNGYSFVT